MNEIIFIGFTLKSGVGRPSNASLVGAKTVTGPGRERMSMRSANCSRDTKMENWCRPVGDV